MAVRFTRKDLEQLPDDWRAELIEGDLVMLASPDPSHQVLVLELTRLLIDHFGVDERLRILTAPTDVVIDNESVLQPDVLVLPEGTRPTRRPWKIPAPVWVAEVLSPSTAHRDQGIKLALYARLGVKEAWIVDPDAEHIIVHDLSTGEKTLCDETATSRVVDGFELAVAPFFAALRN